MESGGRQGWGRGGTERARERERRRVWKVTGLKPLTGTQDDTSRRHLNNLDGLSYIIMP